VLRFAQEDARVVGELEEEDRDVGDLGLDLVAPVDEATPGLFPPEPGCAPFLLGSPCLRASILTVGFPMPLSAGTRLGPYEIVAPLGAGGMGEVYRARDTRLDRTVAVKVLSGGFSSDPVLKQRFEREAKAISSLNHPHICVLYDVGRQDDVDYLVMECVEGETLAKRLEKGALPLDQVLRVGGQIAAALDRAHRAGIVHRDVKPGNIMLAPAGAKLLDFGLAKPAASPVSGATVARAAPVTQEGTLVGTFQYMSPEQVEGKGLDGRSDIFSLGAILYEMLTGQRAFQSKSPLSVASAIVEKEPAPIRSIKPLAPAVLVRVIDRCLTKDPDERWQTACDLASELKWVADSVSQPGAAAPAGERKRTSGRLMLATLVVAAAAALTLGVLYARRPAIDARVARAYIKPMPNSSFIFSSTAAGFALSPDGRVLAYVASSPDGRSDLWVRRIDSLQAQPLPGTDGAAYPFWSPDSRAIGFFAGGKLKKVDAAGGPPFTICDASDGRGGTWNRDGEILLAPAVNTTIFRVPASGGVPVPVTRMDESKNETTHRWPYFLPDGRHFLYFAGSVFAPRETTTNAVMVGSLDSKDGRFLVHSDANAIYASGYLLFMRQYTLMVQPFDVRTLQLTGDVVPVAGPVQEGRSVAKGVFSASDDGLLSYVEGAPGADRQLVSFDRSGKPTGAVPGSDAYAGVRISPDGKRVAYYLDSSGYDVWTYDFSSGVKTALTFGSGSGQGNLYPVWSPDGRRIVYTSYRNGKYGLYLKASDGSGIEERLLDGVGRIRFPTDWSPDGRFITFIEGALGGWAIWMLPLDGERTPFLFQKSQFAEREAAFSPDGKWVAYCSNESGDYKVYVVPFRGPGGKWQVSPGGGCGPRWRRDGREIVYVSLDNRMTATEVKASGSSCEVGATHSLFATRPYGVFGRFDLSVDGQRVLIPYEVGQPSAAITLVINWPAELKRK
jgi:eukaryotic-like serine/threonine-protein kinase